MLTRHPRAVRAAGLSLAVAAVLLAVGLPQRAQLQSARAASPAHVTSLPVRTPQLPCAAVKGLDVSATVGAAVGITGASAATGGTCEVHGVIAPQIQFKLRLPLTTYRQRYLQTGCGGLCGTLIINPQGATGCAPIHDGTFAIATNNQGHVTAGTADGNFGTDPQLRTDFAHRADHLTALAAKALITRFYGAPPQYSYFDGCSQGGHEGLTEAQRYPGDFNGILAGAPASITTELNAFNQPWLARADFDAAGRVILPSSKLPLLHRAVLSRCDRLDGLADGQLDDPRACHFDPATLACPTGERPGCLTPAQIEVVRTIYSGAVDADGTHLYPGGEPYGSELAWAGWMIPVNDTAAQNSTIAWAIGNGWVKYLAFDPNPPPPTTLNDLSFDRATFARAQRLATLYDATSADLTAFRNAGGRLILWHGWADQAIPPSGTVAYYQAIQDRMGGLEATRRFARLFMFPGMYHCSGGSGPSAFDLLTPLLNWVETGAAPSSVTATATGDLDRTRPVYPYPLVARYTGSGSIDEAANFAPARPAHPTDDHYPWLGRFR